VNKQLPHLAVLVAAVLNISFPAKNASAAAVVSADVFYTNVVVAEVPWSIQIVKIPRDNHRYEVRFVHAADRAVGLQTLSDQVIAATTEACAPVAAVNGGFFLRDYGQTNAYAGSPRGLQIVDGEVLSAPSGDATLWVDYSGQPHAANVASQFKITWPDGRSTPFALNGPRTNNEVELYTPAAGASTHTSGGRELVLEPQAVGPWLPLRIDREYLARVREIHTTGDTPLSPNTMVLSISPAMPDQFQTVSTGAVLRISTRSLPVLFNAKTALSGGPVLLRDGSPQKIRAAPDALYELSSMLERHPRTAFGWNDQSFFLVQVDGRQKDLSLGMSLEELSDYLVKLGCTDAMNLDGGGSSSLWFDGKIRNNPCDGYERDIANSLVVLRKPLTAGANHSGSTNAEVLFERSRQNAH
jgi:hypothetical protein